MDRFCFRLLLALTLLASPLALFATEISSEVEMNGAYVGSGKTGLGQGRTGKVTEWSSVLHCVVTPAMPEAYGALLRLGVDWQRFSFGLPAAAPFPNTLQWESLIVGIDLQPSESWLLRVEAAPGLYGDVNNLHGNSFNAPAVIGASYLESAERQWFLGLQVDINGWFPVLPGAGVRWQFAENWLLNAIPPAPRLEYALNRKTTLYGGARIGLGNFRVGDSNIDARLNNAILNYLEIRTGLGASWKAAPGITVELEGGWLPYRQFDYHRAGVHYSSQGGAPYVQLALSGKF